MSRSTTAYTYSPIGTHQATKEGLPEPPEWWEWRETGKWAIARRGDTDVLVTQWFLAFAGGTARVEDMGALNAWVAADSPG